MTGVEKIVRFLYRANGYVFVRPRRCFFWKMVANTKLRLLPEKRYWDEGKWTLPNIHWWVLYKTVFRFFSWLYWDAWRYFCAYKNGRFENKPLIARVIQRIGSTTAGYAISGGECYHCASPDGCQAELSQDETGTTFKLEKTWSVSNQDGTDHRFSGITICPKCGYESEYEDGSL